MSSCCLCILFISLAAEPGCANSHYLTLLAGPREPAAAALFVSMLCCTQAVIQTMSPGRAPISYANAPRGSDFWKTSAKAHLKMRTKLVLSRVAGELLAPCVNNRRGFSLPVGSYHSRRAPQGR